jgi:hypothetical protein
MRPLDAIIRDHQLANVRFVKMDLEGAEMFALNGARELLARQRPVVYCEFHRAYMAANGTTIENVFEYADDLGFDVRYLGRDGALVREPQDARFLNAVLVPGGA